MSKQKITIGIFLATGATVALIIFLTNSSFSTLGSEKIASVNNHGISKEEYQKRLAQTENFYQWGKQDTGKISSLKGDVLDKLIDEQLIKDYAQQKKITVTSQEVEARYKQVVEGYNKNNNIQTGSDSAFLLKIKEMYGTQKKDYMDQLAYDILRDKVQTAVKMPLAQWLTEQKKSADIKKY